MTNENVCVVGLGYVGLTLGVALARQGVNVFGVETNKEIINSLKKNKAHFSEKGLNEIIAEVISAKNFKFSNLIPKESDYSTYIITVGTPLDAKGNPRLDMIKNASREVASNMKDGSLVILRSTVELGTTRNVVMPILEKSNKKFELAMCPERTLEGDAINELHSLPQIIGAESQEISQRCANLFSVLSDKTIITKTFETAEMIKLVDNTSRDLYFSFANEIAEICSLFNIDVYEVIEKGQAEYNRTKMWLPGPVGGPCLEKDPHILANSSIKRGFTPGVIKAGRNMNETQNKLIINKIKLILEQKKIKDPNILICGLAFKGIPETDDLRGSMGIKFLEEINKTYKNITVYDPVVKYENLMKVCGKIVDIESTQECFDLVVLLNNHSKFKTIEWKTFNNLLTEDGFVFDFWNSLGTFADKNKYFHLGSLSKLI